MKKKSMLRAIAVLFCIVPSQAFSRLSSVPAEYSYGKEKPPGVSRYTPPYVYDLDPGFTIQQNVNQKGLVVIEGKFTKPFTSDDVRMEIRYQTPQGSWITAWCKILYSYNQYNENLKAVFELPEATTATYNLKIELNSNSNLSNFNSVVWNKSVSHYKQGDYSPTSCDLDENEYTILLTPKKEGTLILDNTGKVTGIKDRVTSAHAWNKLSNIIMNNKKDDVVFSPNNPSDLLTDTNGSKSVKMVNTGAISDTLGATPEFIYHEMPGHPIPYLYSYDDPVYMFAGKFSINGLMMKFSQWPGEPNGPGYHNFKNPNSLESRYFNMYNTIHEKLSDFMTDQEPIVIVSSYITGFRVYKSNGSYINITNLTAHSNYGAPHFGYTNDQGNARRGPGSEDLIISNTPEMTLYGMGALRNSVTNFYDPIRSLQDIESEISKFINYVGIFNIPYNVGECVNACFAVNSGALPDNNVIDWTKAPNSYIFTGKDKNGNNVDGLYIPVKKAYEMWAKGGDLMKDEQNNYTRIPDAGVAKAGLYWEDEVGLIKSVALEGTGENAKIKVLVNKLKEGNAVVSYRIDDKIYWTWHVWVTDDPTNGSTYHQGFEADKNNNPVTDWKWMDRNLGATNSNLVGHDFHKSGGLQYQWGRKDPFPSNYKDLSIYTIRGEVGIMKGSVPSKYRGNLYAPADNTGFDSPNGNIRYSINNPINLIIPPVYVYKIGETPVDNGENYLIQGPGANDWERKEQTTWFSKNKYKVFNTNNHYDNETWDLWGDTRGGKWVNMNTSDATVAKESKQYAMKSSFDPCPCGWRVPSFYSSVDAEPKTSPWGKAGSMSNVDISPNTLSPQYPGIKVYPGYGFDLSNVADRNLGMLPITGNYEYYPQPMTLANRTSAQIDGLRDANKLYKQPFIGFQDQHSDGALHASTFFSSISPGETPVTGARGLFLISDAGNVPNHSTVGWHNIAYNRILEGNTYETRAVRCIKDPNNAYMSAAFETEYVAASPVQYSSETLKEWTKDPNSYIEYTNTTLDVPAADKDMVIDIPLRKAYAMHNLYLSENNEMPTGSIKSASVQWTTDKNLIANMEIIGDTMENSKLRVTLNQGRTGNAVVAFHLGNTGWISSGNPDPVLWSWHIWVPGTAIQESPEFTTESIANDGIKTANEQFVNPTNSYYGVPLKTILMDRDLGAQMPFINEHVEGSADTETSPLGYQASNPTSVNSLRVDQIKNSGGLHFQWGRKDPIPVFYNPGGFYNYPQVWVSGKLSRPFNTYNVYRQSNLVGGVIQYGAADITNTSYMSNYTKPYSTYSNSSNANVLPTDNTALKIKKVLKYSVNNPFVFLYQNDAAKFDWISDENGLFTERWSHAGTKSPYDPCPAGWRIPDLQGTAVDGVNIFDGYLSYAKGNSPWFYNAKFSILQSNGSYKNFYGIDPTISSTLSGVPSYAPNNRVHFENYNVNKGNYIGGYARSTGAKTNIRYGFVFNKPGYNIGNFANNGIRGFAGGNNMDGIIDAANASFYKSGIWTSAALGNGSGKAAGMYFNSEGGQTTTSSPLNVIFYFTPTYDFNPQAAMSCRCAKIQYDAEGNEIPRYDPSAIPVPKNAMQKAVNTFAKKDIEKMQKDNSKLILFPNPVKNTLYINADDKEYYFQIYSLSGQLIKEGKFEDKQTDVSSLVPGAYLVRINNAEAFVKIIKE